MERRQAIQDVQAAWQELHHAIGGLAREALAEPGVVGTWSVKDVLGHITTWEEELIPNLSLVLAGQRPPRYEDIDAFNAQQREQKRTLPLDTVQRHLDETHRRVLALLETAPESAFLPDGRFMKLLRLGTQNHYREHAQKILQWHMDRGL